MNVFDDAQRRFQRVASVQRAGQLTPRQKSLMGVLARQSGQTLETVGLALDTPGAIVRGVLAGDPLSGFSFNRDDRVSGSELLDAYGLKPENSYASGISGFVTEVATDPLSFVSGPLNALSKAGNVARGANLLDDAPKVASKLFSDPTLTRSFTEKALTKANVPLDSAAALSARPVYGQRYSQVRLTLDDLVRNSADPTKAKEAAERYITTNYKGLTYNDLANQKLGGTFGIGPAFGSTTDVYNPFGQAGAEKIADVLDMTGQAIGWSAPGRFASSLFDQRVGGMRDTGGQIQAMRRFELIEQSDRVARQLTTPMIQELAGLQIPQNVAAQTGVSKIMSGEGNRALTRIIENVPTQNDTLLLSQVPGLQTWVNKWRTLADQLQQKGRDLGLSVHDLKDPNGLEYLPRFGDEFSPDNLDRVVPSGAAYGTKTSDMMARVDALKLKGGLDTIREISRDPRVRKYAEIKTKKLATTETDESVGAHIASLVLQRTGEAIPPEKAARIARIMQDANTDIPGGIGIFSAHPATSITRYIQQRQRSFAVADAAYESLADAVVNQEYTKIPGGQHYTLAEAMQRLASAGGLAAGPKGVGAEVEKQIRDRIAARMGIQPDQVSLGLMSVPAEVVNRLTKLNDFYSKPEAQAAVIKLLNGMTTVFKSFVLAFPSRYTRDLYSGGFQNWLENGSVNGTINGMNSAWHVISGNPDKAKETLMSIPKYAGKPWDQVYKEFIEDVGTSGTLRGLNNLDFSSASITGDTFRQLVPGMVPSTVRGAFSEFAPQAGRTWQQFGKDFFTIRGVNTTYETMNPLLRWGERMNDVTDNVNRLGGFIALLKQGIDPDAAAKRVLASQVNYGSMTPFEQNTAKFIFPWWAYSSRMGKFVVEHLLNRPGGRFGQTIRAVNNIQAPTDGEYIPDYLRQRFAFRDPTEALLPPTGDTKRYIVGFDLPGLEDPFNIIRLSSQSGIANNISDTALQTLGELANQSNPHFRAIAELATGRDMFSKRPLTESYTNADRIYQAMTGSKEKLTPLAKVTINNIPGIQRLLGIGGTLTDQRLSFPERLMKTSVNSTLGFRQATSDPEQEDLEAGRKIGERNAPWNRSFSVSYIPDELMPYVPPEAQEFEKLGQVLKKRVRKRWEAEAKGKSRQVTGTTNNPFLEIRRP